MSPPDDSDEALMRGVAAGDEAAFRLLVTRHLGGILRLAQKMLGSSTGADDVAQEALLRIWTHAAKWRPERAKLTTWLYTIVYRLCIDRLRTQRTVPLDDAMEIEDLAPTTPEILAQESDLRLLAAGMTALEPRQRAALTLFYYEEMSGPDAASVLGISLRAFWSLLFRARQALRRHMDLPSNPCDTAAP